MPDKDSTKKRILKNPQSFRERALKASEEKRDAKPRSHKARSGIGKLLSPIVKPIKELGKNKTVKKILRPFHYIGLIVWPKYLRSSFKELKLVTWPTWRQSRRLTYAVIIFAVVFGTAIAVVDEVLGKIFKNILLK
ncbi:MAG TPA: preprotein translocase subunit SecE [Candidatus Sulfotelmatobacter sp.]|nr:preprotein translocase subunit SecE [Candidatus Sulfotelmatobacter sp.]